MNGDDINHELIRLPPCDMRDSPLLCEFLGKYQLRRGLLSEAKNAFQTAMKGYAGQTQIQRMLSAMSHLAGVLMRMGEPKETEILLRFLLDEVNRAAEPAAGRVYLALAEGTHLLEHASDGRSEERYDELAIERFEHDGDKPGLSEAYFAMMYRQYFALSPERWDSMLRRYHTLEMLNKAEPGGVAILQAMAAFYEKRWSEVFERLNAFAFHQDKHDYIWEEIANGLRIKTQILTAMTPNELQAAEDRFREWEESCSAGTYRDLISLFERETIRYVRHARAGNDYEAKQCLSTLQSLTSLGMQPTHRLALDRLRELCSSALRPAREAPRPNGLIRIEWFHGLKIAYLEREIGPISWKRKKALELFLFLLAQPQYAAPKEWVIEALFNEEDDRKTENRLYVIVHRLKQVMQEYLNVDQGIIFGEGKLRLRDGWIEYFDVEKYMTLARVGNQLWSGDQALSVELFEEAVQLYGDLLPDLQYIDWLERLKLQLADQQANMLGRLGKFYVLTGDPERAAYYFTERVALNPLQEEAYQQLLKVLMQMGRKAEAKDWYAKLEAICREELDTLPLADTKRIVAE